MDWIGGGRGGRLPSTAGQGRRRGALADVIHLVLIGAVAATVFRSLFIYLDIPYPYRGYLAASLPAAVLLAWALLRRPRVGLAILLLLAATAGGWYLGWEGPREWLDLVGASLTEWWRGARAQPGPELLALGAGLTVVPVCLLVAALVFAASRPLWLVPLGGILFAVEWLYYYDGAVLDFALFLVPVLILAALVHLERLGQREGPSPARLLVPTTVAVVLLTTLAAGVAGVLPSHFRPVELGRVADWCLDAFPFLEDLRGYGDWGWGFGRRGYSVARSGFGGDVARLGGPVRTDVAPVLKVRIVDPPPVATLYLRGGVRDVYTGQGWVRGPHETLELATPAVLPFPYPPLTLAWQVTVEVTDLDLRASTVFAPLHPVEVTLGRGSLRVDVLGNLASSGRPPAGWTYRVISWLPFPDPAAAGPEPAPVAADARYLQLPERLPRAVTALARTVTRGASDHLARALAVQAYLRRIPYSLETPPTPRNRDFVDFFLFDLGRGYCTYHSTAMVVMLRAVGVAARWAEGFAVPLPPSDPALAGQALEATITNSNAHAWVEVFLPGRGWFVFDPTPNLPAPAQALPEGIAPAVAPAAPGPAAGPAPPAEAAAPHPDLLEFEVPGVPAERAASRPVSIPRAALLGLGAAILAGAASSTASRAWRLWLLGRARFPSSRTTVEALYRKACHYAGLAGPRPGAAETTQEYLARATEACPPARGPLTVLTRACEAARYGPHPPADDTVREARAAGHAVRREVRAALGRAATAWRLLVGPPPPPLPTADKGRPGSRDPLATAGAPRP